MARISLADPAVQSFMFYSAILGFKLLIMGFLTARQRFRKKVFANEEDAKPNKGKVKFDDPDVERVRRAHRNDLENIPIFWLVGALYLTTGPAAAWATNLFRLYAAIRVMHTIVYALKPMPQPSRIIAFASSLTITMYMANNVILHYISAL